MPWAAKLAWSELDMRGRWTPMGRPAASAVRWAKRARLREVAAECVEGAGAGDGVEVQVEDHAGAFGGGELFQVDARAGKGPFLCAEEGETETAAEVVGVGGEGAG